MELRSVEFLIKTLNDAKVQYLILQLKRQADRPQDREDIQELTSSQ